MWNWENSSPARNQENILSERKKKVLYQNYNLLVLKIFDMWLAFSLNNFSREFIFTSLASFDTHFNFMAIPVFNTDCVGNCVVIFSFHLHYQYIMWLVHKKNLQFLFVATDKIQYLDQPLGKIIIWFSPNHTFCNPPF